MDELRIELGPGAKVQADDLAERLTEWSGGSVAIDASDEHAVEPVTFVLLLAAATIGWSLVTRTVDWLRDRNTCLVIVDGRTMPIQITERCDLTSMRGKTIVISAHGAQLRIDKHPGVLDIERVMGTAIESSVSQALLMLQAAGGEGAVEDPGTGLD